MERNFKHEFERFLKENADQFRLYPSTKVWNGIYTALHTRRKWFGLGIALLLVAGGFVTLLITNSSKQTTIAANKPVTEKNQTPVLNLQSPGETESLFPIAAGPDVLHPPLADNQGLVVATEDNLENAGGDKIISVPENIFSNKIENTSRPPATDINQVISDPNVVKITESQKEPDFAINFPDQGAFDWTIESVLNSLVHSGKTKKVTLQFNIAPTVSYRKLSENKSFLASASNVPSSYVPLYNINSVVTHKPDLGFEFGFTTKYSLSSNFRLKAGLQFNINRYDIKAFNSSFEVAKIDLRGTSGVDSFYAVSTHRNFNGYKSDWLQNFYFEISMPVGAEVNIVGDDKVQFGVAGTVQPTYVLGERAYLLSTDYKNYAEVPWLTRNWNISAGLETFVSYSTGKLRWQIGPQVRYQLLSSFISKYPVKENLFDFGLKVGISRNK